MINKRNGLTVSALSVLLMLLLASAQSINAQLSSAQKKGDPSGTRPPPPPGGNQPRPPGPGTDANQSFQDLELLVSGKSRATSPEDYRKQMAAQFNLDVQRLQQLNNEQIVPFTTAASPDYKKLSRAAAEIRQRAIRIKYEVALELKKKGEKIRYESSSSEFASMLPELSNVIKSFADNPVFHQRDVNDADQRSAAGRDLEGIIKLSGTIVKMSKQLAKTPARSS